LKKVMRDKEVICDLGCGNGLMIFKLASKLPKSIFYGIDSSEEMIKNAERTKKSLRVKNVHFYAADASQKNVRTMFNFRFDKILTKRLLINLKGDKKLMAVKNIHSMLKKNGIYLMVECFIEPLKRINFLRKKIKLEEIKIKKFNEYLTSDFCGMINGKFFRIEKEIDFGSLYYFTSRICNAYLSKGKPDYFSPINKLAAEITKIKDDREIMSSYSPERMLILKKLQPKKG